MDTESEPYVRLATLRQLHQVVADLNTARSLADTLQAVADGVVNGLGYELAVRQPGPARRRPRRRRRRRQRGAPRR